LAKTLFYAPTWPGRGDCAVSSTAFILEKLLFLAFDRETDSATETRAGDVMVCPKMSMVRFFV